MTEQTEPDPKLWRECYQEAYQRVSWDREQGGAYWDDVSDVTFFFRVKVMAQGLFEQRMDLKEDSRAR